MNAIQTVQHTDIREAMFSVQDNYKRQVRGFFRFLDDAGYGVNEDGIKAYFHWLNWESGLAARTINNYREAVKSRLRSVMLDNKTDIRTFQDIEAFLKRLDKMPETKPRKIQQAGIDRDRFLTPEEVKTLLRACRSDKQELYIRFLFITGCRVSEMVYIKLTDCVTLGDRVKITVLGKGAKERTVTIPEHLFKSISETFGGSLWLFETENGKPVHPTYVSKQIKKIGRRIGKEISAHTLRHSWATEQVRLNPGKVGAVSRYLGHSTPSITLQMYVHDSMSAEELFALDL